MATVSKPHVWYAGDWVFLMGPTFVETPFNTTETKDCELRFYGRRLAEALQPVAEVTCTANWDLYRMEPGKLEEYLQRSAVMIVSDVEAKCFHLYPAFFDRARLNKEVVTFPDRLVSLKNWVHDGGGLMMLGGWLSFSGAKETGGWRRTCVAEALPVECLLGEDLVESSAGFTAEVLLPDHPLAKGLPWATFPPIFGYNELIAKADAEVVVRVKETGHPLVVAGRYGKGRIMIYASDPAPHWGINFELWEGYNQFWQQAFAWASRSAQ
ncbi:MAG TPA: glutamine amidotransferase [Phycisphaerae bacterium]|nr:glutamine amidotransferase [Phycisphaerae bacterium]